MSLKLGSRKYAASTFRPRDVAATAVVTGPYIRPTERPASLQAADRGFAAARTPDRYTGTECMGIAAMHKSNLVPIFNSTAAVDAAKMRR